MLTGKGETRKDYEKSRCGFRLNGVLCVCADGYWCYHTPPPGTTEQVMQVSDRIQRRSGNC